MFRCSTRTHSVTWRGRCLNRRTCLFVSPVFRRFLRGFGGSACHQVLRFGQHVQELYSLRDMGELTCVPRLDLPGKKRCWAFGRRAATARDRSMATIPWINAPLARLPVGISFVAGTRAAAIWHFEAANCSVGRCQSFAPARLRPF